MKPRESLNQQEQDFLQEIICHLNAISPSVNTNTFVIDPTFKIVMCSEISRKYTGFSEGSYLEQPIVVEQPIYSFNPQPVVSACKSIFKDGLGRGVLVPLCYEQVHRLTTFYLMPIFCATKVIAICAMIVRYDPLKRMDEYFRKKYLHKLVTNKHYRFDATFPPEKINSASAKAHPKLSELEECIIYLIMKNFSSAEIAEIMSGIENKTITRYYIDKVIHSSLRVKFAAYNRTHLISILYDLGYSEYFPHKIIQDFAHETIFTLV